MLDIERAERDATALLTEVNWKREAPVDPYVIADELGIRVFLAQLGDDISGFIKKEPGSKTEIYIDVDEALVRQRFTCAHELGHFIENRGEEIIAYIDYRDQMRTPTERYANAFAASLLMPSGLVLNCWERYESVAICAKEFDVSQVAMEYRLKNLGIEG